MRGPKKYIYTYRHKKVRSGERADTTFSAPNTLFTIFAHTPGRDFSFYFCHTRRMRNVCICMYESMYVWVGPVSHSVKWATGFCLLCLKSENCILPFFCAVFVFLFVFLMQLKINSKFHGAVGDRGLTMCAFTAGSICPAQWEYVNRDRIWSVKFLKNQNINILLAVNLWILAQKHGVNLSVQVPVSKTENYVYPQEKCFSKFYRNS